MHQSEREVLVGESPDQPFNHQRSAEHVGGCGQYSTQKLYGLLFKERISKNQQLSNWEIDSLTEGQRQYAAIDAWACLRIYHYISELKRTGDYRIIRKDAEECNTEER